MEDQYDHFSEFSFTAVENKYSSSNNALWGKDEPNQVKEVQFPGAEDWGDSGVIDTFCSSNFGFFPDDSSQQGYHLSPHQQKEGHQNLDYGPLDNLQFDMVSPPLQTCLEDIINFDEFPAMVPPLDEEPTKDKPNSTPLASLEILNNYGKGFKRLYGEGKIKINPTDDLAAPNEVKRKLSTEDLMKIAGTRFIQSSSSESEGLQSLVSHTYDLYFSGLSDAEKEDVELAESLLASAEKVGYKAFDRARKLLSQCESKSSKTGNPVKRVISHFSEALRERIDRETGRISSKDLQKMHSFDPDEALTSSSPTVIACYEGLPFGKVSEFAGVQAIIENVTEAKKIHVIDLAIRKGTQWTILMQALDSRRECPLELLKITAIGTASKHSIEEIGKMLMDFAQSMNIPLSFNIVMVSDVRSLREDLFDIDPEETVAVYSPLALRRMLQQPDQLETIMRVIRTINPIVMVVTEIEANFNSTAFVNRFIEALFYFSAFFDCLETCMERNDPNRMIAETLYFGCGIKNVVAAEGTERKVRDVKIDVWRAFFSRFGMVETELSMSSLYQAELMAKRFACASACTFDMNGNTLLIGWKGTPLKSVSVWKFP